MNKNRCSWAGTDPLMISYHDTEWGVPLHDENKLFEFLILEGAQSGLSWSTILKRRENYRKAFDNFDPEKVALYNSVKINSLLQDSGIIRNKLKIAATIQNAKSFLAIQKEFGSFDKYIWEFKDANEMSEDLLKRGFKFVGPTICYAFMQATGIVNDHESKCFRNGKFFVYMLRTSSNTLYVGQTNDLEKRMAEHKNKKGSKYMRSFSSFTLAYCESYETRSQAMKREAEIKKCTKAQKEALINKLQA